MCQELRADARVQEVATMKLDQRMLAITSRELVAAEGHYHRSCYRLYSMDTIPTRSDLSANTEQATEENYYQTIEILAFKELLSYIRNELIPNPKVLAMTDLTSRLQIYMSSCGVNKVNDSTKNTFTVGWRLSWKVLSIYFLTTKESFPLP